MKTILLPIVGNSGMEGRLQAALCIMGRRGVGNELWSNA
jgi:hypothetical protein